MKKLKESKGYAEIISDHIERVMERYGNGDITRNYMLGQIALNIAMLTDAIIEIYGSERRKEIDNGLDDKSR